MPVTLPAQIGTAAYLVVCIYACTRRDLEVRLFGAAVALDEVLYLAAWRRMSFFSTAGALTILDALLLAAIVGLAWRGPRPWLISAGALQLVCTLAHPVTMFDHHVRERALATLLLALGYGVLACVLWAAVEVDFRWRRKRRQKASIEADRAVWRAKGDVETALLEATDGIGTLQGRERAEAEAILLELARRREGLRPHRGDAATRRLRERP